MKMEGPGLEHLLRRLIECPNEFWELCEPKEGTEADGLRRLHAILCDHFRAIRPTWESRAILKNLSAGTPHHRGLLGIVAWLLHDPWFLQHPKYVDASIDLVCGSKLSQLAARIQSQHFVHDPDRREELVRVCLAELGLRPQGESLAQAKDRLNTLDSVERDRVLKATLAAEKRAREVREAMERAKALESSSRYGE